MALELKDLGMLEFVYPVFIGKLHDGVYDRFRSNCYGSLPDLSVINIESKVTEHLSRQALGSPLHLERTVKATVRSIHDHQGWFIEGEASSAWDVVVDKVHTLCRVATKSSETHAAAVPNVPGYLEQLQRQLADTDSELAAKNLELVAKDSELAAVVAAKDSELGAKDSELAAKLAAKDSELAAKDSELALIIAAKNSELAAMSAARDSELAAKYSELAAKNSDLAAMVTARDSALAAKDSELAAMVAAKDSELAAKDSELAAKESECWLPISLFRCSKKPSSLYLALLFFVVSPALVMVIPIT